MGQLSVHFLVTMSLNNICTLATIFAAVLFSETAAMNSDPLHGELRRHLLTTYDSSLVPLQNQNHTLKVGLGISMIHIESLSSTGILLCTAWFKMKWNDYRFKWKTEDFSGVSKIRLDSGKIWKPDVEAYNSADINEYSISNEFTGATNAVIYNTGNIIFIPPVQMKVFCHNFSYSAWPLGEQECSIKLGSWTHDAFIIDLELYKEDMDHVETTDLSASSPWQITEKFGNVKNKKYYACCDEPYVDLNYRFKLEPHPSYYPGDLSSDRLGHLVGLGVTLLLALLLLLVLQGYTMLKNRGKLGQELMQLSN